MRFVAAPCDFDSWRITARKLLAEKIAPSEVTWSTEGTLFNDDLTVEPAKLTVTKAFIEVAAIVSLHRDASRWPLLYTLLYRLTHGERSLLEIDVDPDVHRAFMMAKAVKRDMHKMKAFVRFRKVDEQYIAWHRPDHYIVEAMAPWFVARFGSMHWTILTPDRSAYWDTKELRFGPGVLKSQAPEGDTLEELWRSYYAAIFNPARLKVAAMKAEMPVRHWATLPEAELIPKLIAQAAGREETMRTTQKTSAAPFVPPTHSIPVLQRAARSCEGCDLYKKATQTVFGTGPSDADVVFVGEQPGDAEDLKGQPFVGPAGKLLDRALVDAGIDRSKVYVTNAVKHFKFEERGKRRIHKKPSGSEIAACHPWLEAELDAIKPKLVVALGATAALALAGKDFKITRDRGILFPHPQAGTLLATIHPSALLRMPEPERREAEYAHFVADLKVVQARIEEFRAA